MDHSQLRYWSALPDHPLSQQYGMGAVYLHPDARRPLLLPVTRAPGAALTGDLTSYIHGTYDQGMEPSCVAFSSCAVKSIDDQINMGHWWIYNGHQLYAAAGGNGSNGVYTPTVLEIMKFPGVQVLGTQEYRQIASYGYIPYGPDWRDTIKACIEAQQAILLAVLLPSDFGVWDQASTVVTNGYHQVAGVGFDPTYLVIDNSWGSAWGRNGLARLRWDYLEADNWQRQFCYAYKVVDTGQPPPPPPPPPPPADPHIDSLAPAAGRVGTLVRVLGSNLGVSMSRVRFGDTLANLQGISTDGTWLLASVPALPDGDITVTVTRTDGKISNGAIYTVQSAPPPPPGPLTLTITQAHPLGRGVRIEVRIDGEPGMATIDGNIGGRPLRTKHSHVGFAVSWDTNGRVGELVTLRGMTTDGRTASATATVK